MLTRRLHSPDTVSQSLRKNMWKGAANSAPVKGPMIKTQKVPAAASTPAISGWRYYGQTRQSMQANPKGWPCVQLCRAPAPGQVPLTIAGPRERAGLMEHLGGRRRGNVRRGKGEHNENHGHYCTHPSMGSSTACAQKTAKPMASLQGGGGRQHPRQGVL